MGKSKGIEIEARLIDFSNVVLYRQKVNKKGNKVNLKVESKLKQMNLRLSQSNLPKIHSGKKCSLELLKWHTGSMEGHILRMKKKYKVIFIFTQKTYN